ncbi:hypothetical protein PUN28_018894 [Cardiocondyla obscurior]|uniref:Uncharacterized protein n=1 Tax=Cardiocondyla obscurior TaxID=286306 RepID=A0AAW2EF78_9HYME
MRRAPTSTFPPFKVSHLHAHYILPFTPVAATNDAIIRALYDRAATADRRLISSFQQRFCKSSISHHAVDKNIIGSSESQLPIGSGRGSLEEQDIIAENPPCNYNRDVLKWSYIKKGRTSAPRVAFTPYSRVARAGSRARKQQIASGASQEGEDVSSF